MMHCASMFSGGGLADVGLVAAGYAPTFAVEYDADIAACYAANLGAHVTVGRVEDHDYREWSGIDLAWASPSCVRVSVANPNAGETEEDRSAAAAVCRMLKEARPARFVLENVIGYREWESFRGVVLTLMGLGYAVHWSLCNAADYGVPQTRRRLILRALRDRKTVPPLASTHTNAPETGQGCLFGDAEPVPRWCGWYAAVEDLLPGLPDSAFAEWQLKRLPESLGTCLVNGQNAGRELSLVDGEARSFAVTAGHKGLPRAVLVDSQQTYPAEHREDRRKRLSSETEPAFCVPATVGRGVPRALLVQGTSTLDVRECSSPSPSVVATVHTKAACPRAWLVDCVHRTDAPLTVRRDTELAHTIKGSDGRRPGNIARAWLEQGRVVQMNARCLARFQSLPDSYALPEKNKTAFRVVGNGVPPLMARRIAESLR